jgi:hypothetical protein
MSKKRKRRLGHITDKERVDVRESVRDADARCIEKYHGEEKQACLDGVVILENRLSRRGF